MNGIGTLTRRLRVPVHMTQSTWERLPRSVGSIPRLELFEPGEDVRVDGIVLTSFSVSHDAADPVSFMVRAEGVKLGLASDLGHASHLVRNRLAGSHALILEANYCPDMLRRGPYPPAVQQRIRSKHGHLSNKAMGNLLASLLHDALQVVVLAHVR